MVRGVFQSILAVFLVCVAFSSHAMAERRAAHVLIVSFDGGKPAVMQQSAMPVLMEAAKAGAVTWGAQTIFPSITLVSHASMLAGIGPEKHKILWNSWVPEKGKFTFPTVFSIAKAAGMHTALFAGKDKFLHFDAPGALDDFAIPNNKAKVIAETAGKYIVEKKPDLIFVHFPDGDSAGHRYGWGSPEQILAFADTDAALKTLLDALKQAGIDKETVVILSADHGGHDKTHGSNAPEDMTIPWIALGKGVRPDQTITGPVTTFDTAATALWLLGLEIPADWDGKPVTSAFAEPAAAK